MAQETKPRKKSNPNFLNGVPLLLVLKLLAEKEMYGYELVRAIEERTGQSLSFDEGCVYPTLHVLEEDGCVKSRAKSHNGRTRHYYSLTPSGKKKLEQMAGEWEKVAKGIRLVLAPSKVAS